jgi:hypothetical protein
MRLLHERESLYLVVLWKNTKQHQDRKLKKAPFALQSCDLKISHLIFVDFFKKN